MLTTKLKAGSLQLILFIVVVVALLLAAFLILVHTQKQFGLKTDFVIETIDNSNKGVDFAKNNDIALNDTIALDLKDEDYKSLKVYRDFWGIYEKVIATSKIKNFKIQKVAFLGTVQNDGSRTALYLEDQNKPLVLVGNTQIKGNVYLPKRGVKSGNISGVSYYGSELIYGVTKTSQNLPRIKQEVLTHLENLGANSSLIHQDRFVDLNRIDTLKNSFLKPYQLVFSNREILLENKTLVGNIIIQSKTKVTIEATTQLKDIVVVAPEIEIKDGFKGALQAVATKTIVVAENVSLNYPSALVIATDINVNTNQQQQLQQPLLLQPSIILNSNSSVSGVIVFKRNSIPYNYEPQVVINNNATVVGEIYCNQNLELKGVVEGTIYTSNFVAKQDGSIYQNHIYNGKIDIDELPKQYVGLSFDTNKSEVVKWMY